MPAISASAPGKAILFGEHAVVYQRPAIAVPVHQVRAKAVVMARPGAPSGEVWIDAPDIGLNTRLDELPEQHPFRTLIQLLKQAMGLPHLPALHLHITSTIPLAAGLGSGAAVSVAMLRSLSAFLGHPLADQQVCELSYEAEKYYHGTPSGIDNTVITYSQPILFTRGQPYQILPVGGQFTLIIADSGIQSSTAEMVQGVRQRYEQAVETYEARFDAMATLVEKARHAIQKAQLELLGQLMNTNHQLLQQIGVSTPQLDELVRVAGQAGALGAKLSGAGGGGNIIALAPQERVDSIQAALRQAGSSRTLVSHIHPTVANR
jgi:mevalonate kinase